MDFIHNQNYLKQVQYRDSTYLDARIRVHKRFSTNPYGWFRWVMDVLALQDGNHVVEVGCGTGLLWSENRNRIPAGLQVGMMDLTSGMLRHSLINLGSPPGFSLLSADAQAIPIKSGWADRAIANHMLYHVPDISAAIGELRRVLRPSGWCCAATNGQFHMTELYTLIGQVVKDFVNPGISAERFTLENAFTWFETDFARTETHIYKDALWVTAAQPLMDYILSMWSFQNVPMPELMEELYARVEFEISQKGGFHITKSSGLVTAFPV